MNLTRETALAGRPLAIADLKGVRSTAMRLLPLLKPRFEAFAAALLAELRPFAAITPRLEVDAVEPASGVPEIYESQVHWICRRFAAEAGDAGLDVRLDQNFLHAFCELAFGGDGSAEAYAAERGRSRIEDGLADLLYAAIGRSLPRAFPETPAASLQFRLAETGKAPQAAIVAEVSLLLGVFGYGGELTIGLTNSALGLFKAEDEATRQEEAPVPHPGWGSRIETSLGGASLLLRAVLAETGISLQELGSFETGQVIGIPVRLDTPLKVYCEDRHLLDATFARSGQAYVLAVDRLVPQP